MDRSINMLWNYAENDISVEILNYIYHWNDFSKNKYRVSHEMSYY
jgi:hypothetical protein